MAFRISTDLKNYMCNVGVAVPLSGTYGTDGTASLNLYSGTQPSTADSGTTGTLIATITGISWSSGVAGTASLFSSTGYSGTATIDGTIGWGRMENIGAFGTCRVDGDCGTSGSEVFAINVNVVSADDVVTLHSADIYMG